MSLLALFPFLRAITGRVWVYIALAACAVSFFGGYWINGKFEQAKQLAAVSEARAKERGVALIGNSAERDLLGKWKNEQEKSNAAIKRLRDELARSNDCAISGAVVGVLDDASVPATPGDSTSARPPAAAPPEASTCGTQLEICASNYGICNENSRQLESLQRWYRQLRREFNASP